MLTVPDGSHGELYERIDAGSRWAGVAAIDGALLRETAGDAARLGSAIDPAPPHPPGGARHLAAEGAVAILDRERISICSSAASSPMPTKRAAAGSDRLLAPIERAGTAFLMGGRLSAQLIGFAAALLTGLGAAAFYVHWYWTGLAALLVATPLEGVARRLARLRMQDGIRQSWWAYLVQLFGGAALVVLAFGLAADPRLGHGPARLHHSGLPRRARDRDRGAAGPRRALPRRAQGHDLAAPALRRLRLLAGGPRRLFAYAAGSFFWAQREAHAASAVQDRLAPV